MVVCDPIVDAMDLDGGSVVARTPLGTRVFAKGDWGFADVGLGGQRLVGQGGQIGQVELLIERPVK